MNIFRKKIHELGTHNNNKKEHNGNTYDEDGYNLNGYDKDGYDRAGYDVHGYDRHGYNKDGYDKDGFDEDGYYLNGYDKDGYDRAGYDEHGYDRRGYNKDGYDKDGFDEDGYYLNGYDKDGYDRAGYDVRGYDRAGYDKIGRDKNGYDRHGYDRNGYDKNGYDREGYDRDRYDRNGYDRNGFDRNGYDKSGYNRDGYDKDGYNKDEHNKNGFDRYEQKESENLTLETNEHDFHEYQENEKNKSFVSADSLKRTSYTNYEMNSFEALQIGLASPDKIRSWSHGEVTKPETINYRTLKPEMDGLYCERIFGPTKDWECHCGKYKRIRYKGIVCDKCGVEVTKAKVRRERMGHIELAAPVSHIWYFKGIPSIMGLILDISPTTLEKVLYFANYIVIDPGNTDFAYKEILTEVQWRMAMNNPALKFKAGSGAEAIKELLLQINLEEMSADLSEKLKRATGQKRIRIARRLEVIEAFRVSGNRPEWMILDVIPVIPPDLRPMVQLDGGRFATSDLNDLYRRVINRNNRIKRLLQLNGPDYIVRNEKRMLQEAVDALIDNGRRGMPATGPGQRALKSLSDMLKGPQGRFRQNLLGKRVDYSGRSVIVVGPELKFYQCGLPKEMALELFKPFIMNKLLERGYAHNSKSAKRMVEKAGPKVWDMLESVIKEHPVMLNRAPTLNRLGIQAFEPVLVEGKAIKIHPLVCTAFNADFDGDLMTVHVPLSEEAQAEARFLMLSANNILAPRDGTPITTPTKDMVLGSYYLTFDPKEEDEGLPPEKGDGSVYADMSEMLMAYETKKVSIHARVRVRIYNGKDDERGKLVESTVGRFIFNQEIPQDLGYVDREENPYSLEIDFLCTKKILEQIIDRCYRIHGNTDTVLMLDYIKDLGFHYSTKAAITIGISDMEIPEAKESIIAESEALVDKYDKAYRRGLVSDKERYEKVIEIWNKTTDDVADALMDSLGSLNNLFIMAHSGARGSKNQIRQIGGMRGLMANATGKTIEIPIKANFREGLSVLEYFLSANGARKGLVDTALRTADSGYLTRRLVDASHNVVIREDDCGTEDGIIVSALTDGKEVIEQLKDRIVGRTALDDIVHPWTGEIIVEMDEEITEAHAQIIEDAGITEVGIRSAMTCRSKSGVCAKCYGRNLATGESVDIGDAVGIQAAQSIGESGTHMAMRTIYTDDITRADITQGISRVEELFEARKPKGLAQICEADGAVVSIQSTMDNKTEVIIRGDEEVKYSIPYGAKIVVSEGDYVEAGENITFGPLDPEDILRLQGVEGVYQYLLKEVLRVYKKQGIDINDKHIEVIINQMLSKLMVINAGDTRLIPGRVYSRFEVEEANEASEVEGKEPAQAERLLLGITKISLTTNSFLSAASFQEPTRVLTDAAIKGKTDYLEGLKENVIIGKLIPAGTGMRKYRNGEVDYGINTSLLEAYRESLLEAEMEDDEYDYFAFEGVAPEMATADDIESVAAYAAEDEFLNEI